MKKLYFLVLALCFGLTTGYAQVVSISSEDTLVNPTELFINVESSGSTAIGIGVSNHNDNYVWFDAFPLIDGTNKISWKNTYPLDTTVFVEITEFGTGAKFYTQFVVDMPTPQPDSIYFVNPSNGDEIIGGQKFTVEYNYTGLINAIDKYYMKYKLNASNNWYTEGQSFDFQNWADVYKITPGINSSTIDLGSSFYNNIDTGMISLALVEKTADSFKIIDSIEVKIIPTPPHFISITNINTEYYISDTIELAWTSFDIDSVNILLSLDSGATFTPIATNLKNTGKGSFIVPNTLPATIPNAFIQIASNEKPDIFINSKSFKLYDVLLSMAVTAISPGTSLTNASTMIIDYTWNGQELVDEVFLKMSLDSGANWTDLDSELEGTTELYTELYKVKNGSNTLNWFLAPNFPLSDNFMFRFINRDTRKIYGTSPAISVSKGKTFFADSNMIKNYTGDTSTLKFRAYNIDSCNIYISYDSVNYTLLESNIHLVNGLNTYSFQNAKIDFPTEKYTFYIQDADQVDNKLYTQSYKLWNNKQSIDITYLSKTPIPVNEKVNIQISYDGWDIDNTVTIAYKNQSGQFVALPYSFPFMALGTNNGQLTFDKNAPLGEDIELYFIENNKVISINKVSITSPPVLEITSDFMNAKYYQNEEIEINLSSYDVDSVMFLASINGDIYMPVTSKKLQDGYSTFKFPVPVTEENTIEVRIMVRSVANGLLADTTEAFEVFHYQKGVHFTSPKGTVEIARDSVFSLTFYTTIACTGDCQGYVILPSDEFGVPDWDNRFAESADYFWKAGIGIHTLSSISIPAKFLGNDKLKIYLVENGANGDILKDSITIVFPDVATSIYEVQSLISTISPNPTNGSFMIEVSGNIQVVDAQGILIESFVSKGTTVFGENYKSGLYFLTVNSNSKVETVKLIKQ